jgi:hypothetical protein
MRAIMLAALLWGCDRKPRPETAPDNGTIVDVVRLEAVSPAADRDINALIHDRLPRLSRCADPVRELVRRSEPGFGSIPIVVHAVGKQGREVDIRSVSVMPRLPPSYDSCMTAAFLGAGPTIATGDYDLTVRLHMCVDPEGPP